MSIVNGAFTLARRIVEDKDAAAFSVATNALGITVVLKLLFRCPGEPKGLGLEVARAPAARMNEAQGGEIGARVVVLAVTLPPVRAGQGNAAVRDGAGGTAQHVKSAGKEDPLPSAGRR